MKITFSRVFIITLLILSIFGLASCKKEDKKLSAPTEITYDGTSISWQAPVGADKYVISINGGTELSTGGTTFTYMHNGESSFSVNITAIDNDGEFENSDTVTHTFIPLATVQNITVNESGDIAWNAVNNAAGYIVSVDGVETTVYSLSYDKIGAGNHAVKVKAMTDSATEDTSYYSHWSAVQTVNICENIDKDTLIYSVGERSISWKGVTGASAYEITIAGTGISNISETVKTTSYTFDAKMTSFDVTVRAIGNHSNYYDSPNTTKKSFVYLDTVQNIRVVDGTLYWDEVSEANGYSITLNGVPYAKAVTECKLSGFQTEKTNLIKILPLSNNTVYFSSWSAEFSFIILPAPTIQWANLALDGEMNNNTYWNTVANASGYEVSVYYEDQPVDTATLPSTVVSYAYDFLQAGNYSIRVKALAPDNTSNICDSEYSAPIYVTRLAAPVFASNNYITSDPNNLRNGFTVSFKPVAGASGYQIWKDDTATDIIDGMQSQYTDAEVVEANVITAQQYNYAIQSLGRAVRTEVGGAQSVILDSLSSEMLNFVIDVLAAPVNCTISGYEYTYSNVKNSFGYTISVNGQAYQNNDLSFDLETVLKAGTYNVSVCARGNGSQVLSSNYTPAITVNRLSAPLDIKISTQSSSDGVIEFSQVDYAKSYELYIHGSNQVVKIAEMTNIKDYISTDGTSVHMISVANYFNTLGTVYYMTSEASTTQMFTKLTAPTFGSNPFGNTQFSWNSPSNVNTSVYTPTYLVYNAQNVVVSSALNSPVMNTASFEAGAYELKVQAIGDGITYINSDFSSSLTMTKLDTPEVTIKNNQYTWSAVASATSYAVIIDGNIVYTANHQSGMTYSYAPSFTQLKEYNVDIVAVGNGGTVGLLAATVDSTPYTILQKTEQLTTPEFSWSYSSESYVADGTITVKITKASENANGYVYLYDGATFTDDDEHSFIPNSNGSVILRVYANGGGFDSEGVYYIDSQSKSTTIHILQTPGNVSLTSDGVLTWGSVSNASMYELDIIIGDQTYTVSSLTSATYNVTKLDNLYSELAGVKITEVSVIVRALGASNCIASENSKVAQWTNINITI